VVFVLYNVSMNREIKFREYNSHWNKMYEPFTLINAITAGGISDRYNKHSIFMQYTGLKDINGVEIYEGDILTDGKNNTSSVEWRNFLASYMLDFNYANTELYEVLLNKVKIIGNIYENPELLDNK